MCLHDSGVETESITIENISDAQHKEQDRSFRYGVTRRDLGVSACLKTGSRGNMILGPTLYICMYSMSTFLMSSIMKKRDREEENQGGNYEARKETTSAQPFFLAERKVCLEVHLA